ncbi:hypothetical protein H8B13_14460 [Hymenobacter sp. BT188]|uniref:hypothetical protein n=1 Tax=Hymenobacter sp. BT188 TaxID=2763504 RepID=UPI0016513EBB|nr:hypothetical protein [Hymenobacter sp. BT188]MBC6608026.1 hypothetical protein [Hymenobacter sp. BT188]
MKRIYTLVCVMISLASGLSFTALADNGTSLNARATQLTRQMAQKVRLDEGQYVKVKRLNLQMLAEMEEAKTRLSSDPAALDQYLAEVQSHYEWDLAAILWPKQMVAYNQSKTTMTAVKN